MRKYYILQECSFPTQIRDSNLRNRVEKFKNKYKVGHAGVNRNYFTIPHFLTKIHINNIYAYSEENCLYEFFSGKQIGTLNQHPTHEYQLVNISSTYLGNKFPRNNITSRPAAIVADEVKSLVPHSKIIGEVIMEYLELLRLVDLSNEELAEQEKRSLVDENKKKTLLLEDFLDKRK